MENTVLGLPLNIDLGDGNYKVSPLSALVVLKGIDSDGDEVHIVSFTEGVSPMEGLAFADFAKEFCRFQLRKGFYAAEQ